MESRAHPSSCFGSETRGFFFVVLMLSVIFGALPRDRRQLYSELIKDVVSEVCM